MTIFEKIAAGEIPARIVHEAADFLAFHDVNPQAPVHVLVVPRRCIVRLADAQSSDADLLGRMLLAAPVIAAQLGIAESGYRVVINNGRDAGESVPHLHIHVLGGRGMRWPPG
jgi:histidine triad (HIT) family protein